jgi:hypothetical protein
MSFGMGRRVVCGMDFTASLFRVGEGSDEDRNSNFLRNCGTHPLNTVDRTSQKTATFGCQFVAIHIHQTHGQGVGGGASGCNAPPTNLSAPTRNLQNIKDKHADRPAKKRTTPYSMHVLPLLNRCGWKQLLFKIYVYARHFVQCFRGHCVIKVLILWY